MEATYTVNEELRQRCIESLEKLHYNKAMMAIHIGIHRSTVSKYLNGKEVANVERVESAIEEFLDSPSITEELAELEAKGELKKSKTIEVKLPVKKDFFESKDAVGVIGVCKLCQSNSEIGIIVGRSGYGKTHSLLRYANLPKVAYVECNETMNNKDLVRRIEGAVGLPRATGSIDERLERIINFFNANQGYLLVVDEADKLITKYTQKKIEMLRNIADGANVGIVIAGEPALESCIKSFDERLANRMAFYYKLKGLSSEEIKKYFSDYEIAEGAMEELRMRAVNRGNGCFRLLDRTLNNILRILKDQGQSKITMDILNEASNMMML